MNIYKQILYLYRLLLIILLLKALLAALIKSSTLVPSNKIKLAALVAFNFS
jgi:hypothetical protein